uniref:Uncharacterized protein n=1 Tax=Triticum urartu TaxID=4572 RepID=A0A8R7RB89_TRIUA
PPFTAATLDRSTTQCQAVRCRSSGGAHLNLSTPPPGCSCSSVPSGKFVLQHMVSLSCTCLYRPTSPAPQAALLSCACCSTDILQLLRTCVHRHARRRPQLHRVRASAPDPLPPWSLHIVTTRSATGTTA